MSDLESLNDPELDKLQTSLAAIAWLPTPSERDRLLYECGRAAGRAEWKGWARGLSVATASLLVASVLITSLLVASLPNTSLPLASPGAGYLAPWRPNPARDAVSPVADASSSGFHQEAAEQQAAEMANRRMLRVSTRLEDWPELWTAATRASSQRAGDETLEPVMSAVSRNEVGAL